MEGFIIIIGLCITFTPAVIFANYIINKPYKVTKFDEHLDKVSTLKGKFGIVVAYLERILYGLVITSMGVVLSDYFKNILAIEILIVSIILYFIVKYFDEKNEKI